MTWVAPYRRSRGELHAVDPDAAPELVAVLDPDRVPDRAVDRTAMCGGLLPAVDVWYRATPELLSDPTQRRCRTCTAAIPTDLTGSTL